MESDYTCPFCTFGTSDPAEYIKHNVEHSFESHLLGLFEPKLTTPYFMDKRPRANWQRSK